MTRFYRALLRLYPASFRREYRDELTRAFAERTSHVGAPSAAIAAVADVLPNAAAAHWEILLQDLAYAARSLRRTPGFAVTAVLVAALGIGANTAVFSLADVVFVRPLPYADADRLVKLWESTPGYAFMELSPANYRDWKAAATSFSGMAAYSSMGANFVSGGPGAEPRRIEVGLATPELLPLLGIPPIIGRTFTADEVETGSFIVLSSGLWQSQFGGDPAVIGKTVRLEGEPRVVLGVMPPAFSFPYADVEAWIPHVLRESMYADRNNNYLQVVARLRAGVTIEQARRELALIATRLSRQYPKDNKDVAANVVGLRDDGSERARLLVIALCGAALCILLLACANLASLFLARATYRARELAVRAALGAGRERLVRQLVTESIAIAGVGGVVGVAAARAGAPLLARLVPSNLPIAASATLDYRVLLLATLLILVTGLAFGLAPAMRAGRVNALDALRGGARAGGGRTQRLRAGLVIVEVTASVVLLITSGLLIRAVWQIRSTDPGFVAEHALRLQTALPMGRYDSVAARKRFYGQVLENVRSLPGVRAAAYTTGVPIAMRGRIWPVALQGEEVVRGADNSASLRFITPQYFASMRIPVRRGRDVAETDTREQPLAAVVSESFAKRWWPQGDPIGKRFTVAFSERTVVGVVGDVKVRGLERLSEPQVYLPYAQVPDGAFLFYAPQDLVVRVAPPIDAASLLPRIREIVRQADPEQPISNVQSLEAVVADDTASRVAQLRLLGALSAIALLIAGLGIHGLLTFSVSKRAQELGVRRALGAQAGEIIGLVLREGLALAVAGIVIGVAVAYAAARGMGALLAGIQPNDAATIGAATGVCLVVALVGCLRPALRAARVDPLSALRAE